MVNLDCVRQFRKLLAQPQPDLFRGRADICKNNDRVAGTNQLRQLRIEARASVARWGVGVAADRRENVDDLFLLDPRFRDAATSIFADKEFGKRIQRRGGGGEADAAELIIRAGPASLCQPCHASGVRTAADDTAAATDRLEPFQGNAQVCPSLVAGE